MRTPVIFWTLVLFCLLSFSIACGGGGDDDDDSGGTATDDDVNDDVNDDVDDDTDDDVDADDDADDDVDDDADDDADDDTTEPTTTTTTTTTVVTTTSTTTTTLTPPSCEGEQVNNGPLDVDNDGDGYSENIGDCNDDNNAVNPDMVEVFDGVDNNCDGTIDEGFDADCDGYQSEDSGGDDCKDNDWQINPGAIDDGLILIDFNCDGVVGDVASGDADGDGFAALGTSGGIVDCDDNDFFVFPGNAPLDDPVACMKDEDFDDYGDDQAIAPIIAGTDCDDSDLLSNPGAPELPDDGVNQNCVGGDLILGNDTGVFVATTGDDANSGTMVSPKQTISAGANLAALTGKFVFVAAGNYTEDVETEVSLFGGYESSGWTRDMDANVTTINAELSTAVKVVETETMADDTNPVAIQGFFINGGSPADDNSYGVYNGDGTMTLANNVIDGGSPSEYDSNSYGVYNEGVLKLMENTINGGSPAGGGVTSYGVYNQGGVATLANNTINGGSPTGTSYGEIFSYGIRTSGTATLTNNVINGGSPAGEYSHTYSNGIRIYGSAVITSNTIDGGSPAGENSDSFGVTNNGSAMITNNTIDGGSPTGDYGDSWGVTNYGGTAMLVSNTIDGGSPTADSGDSYGIYNRGAEGTTTLTLVNNIINGGSPSGEEGDSHGVYNRCDYTEDTTVLMLIDNTINGGAPTGENGNSHGAYNSGDDCEGTAILILVNNAINGGSGSYDNYGVYNDDGTLTLVNNDIWGADMDCMVWYYDADTNECEANTITSVNACAWTGCTEASGNISDDPLFDVDGYHLTDSSPCINTGIDPVPDYIGPGLVDFDFEGDARPYGAGWDIGMDEWTP